MMDRDSSYYPRRATFWSPLLTWLDQAGQAVTRYKITLPETVTLFGLIAAMLVPGLAVYFRHPDRSGKAALQICALLILFFFVFLGHPAANTAFTVLLCIHVIGLVAYCTPLFVECEWPTRFLWSLALCAFTIGGLYLPAQQYLTHHLFLPVRAHGHVVVVQRMSNFDTIQRGEWIAFEVSATHNYFDVGYAHGNVIIHDGLNFAPVLAVPGDDVKFDATNIYVNGVASPRASMMPVSGEFIVPNKCVLAWPELARESHGVIPPADITGPLLQLAEVGPDRYLGKAFKHWFGHRQTFT
jgi:hypothetical protein